MQQVSFFRVSYCPTCICFSPDGKGLAIGNEVGELCVYQSALLSSLLESKTLSLASMLVDAVEFGDWELVYRRNIATKGMVLVFIAYLQNKGKLNCFFY